MNVAAAAPLLCAGITCYSPLKKHGVKKGTHLGVVGLGGLGHMAVKIGAAMGAIVTVITTSEAKREMALKARVCMCTCMHVHAHVHAYVHAHVHVHVHVHVHANAHLDLPKSVYMCAHEQLSHVPSQMGATTVVLSTDKAAMQAARKYNSK